MCGIVALALPAPLAARAQLGRALCQLLAHRGPDDEDFYHDPDVPLTLGHRRLSIIDLSADGRQPMSRGPLVLAFNGEIYNYLELRQELAARGHVFRTRSDTEVLLAALAEWGEEALQRTNGMFAILLWDRSRRRLSLVRDRFGVKPLYYLVQQRPRPMLLCASEPKAILAAARALGLPVEVERDVLCAYLADAPTEDDERTFFRRVHRVLPSEIVTADLARLEQGLLPLERRFWYALTPDRCPPPSGHGDEQFLDLLTDSIRLRLRSDVPVGTCLSGGLDSSAVVCVASRRLGVRPHTFSAVHGAGDPADESRFIDTVVAHAEVPSHRVNPAERFSADAFLAFLALQDEPVGGTTVWAQHSVFQLAREHGVKVMLDGQGADETLTGYQGAFRPLWAHLLGRGALVRLGRELCAARRLHGLPTPQGLLGAAWLLLTSRAPRAYALYLERRWQRHFASGRHPGFHLYVPPPPRALPHTPQWSARSPLHAYLYQLIFGSSLQTILRYEDRNSMAASIEAREPFLDVRLVEHCLGHPPEALVENGQTKALLRRALRGVLPERVRQRTDKIGFATPEARWLRGPLRPLLLDLLASPQSVRCGLLDVPTLHAIFRRLDQDTDSRASAASYALFKALNVELWLRQHHLSW